MSIKMLLIAVAVGLMVASAATAASLVVTSAGDAGAGTLRAAIETSNGNGVADTITFGATMTGKTVRPITPLPALTEGNLTIDGDTNADGAPDIVLRGSMSLGTGLDVRSSGNTIRKLTINLFHTGIALNGYRATGNVITGCRIGTDAAASYALGNDYGILVTGDAASNTIGGSTPAQRNVISGNGGAGIAILNSSTIAIRGNYIGTDRTGAALISNGAGIMMYDSESCTIGSSTAGGGNLISGNALQDATLATQEAIMPAVAGIPVPDRGAGIIIHRGTRHAIVGNSIGTQAAGAQPLRNSGGGVVAINATYVTIGGTTVGARNIISGNRTNAGISASSCTSLKVLGNYIGTNAAGDAAVGNGSGVELFSCGGAMIGGTTVSARNVISGNAGSGVSVNGGQRASVLGNYIGVSASGAAALGNGSGVVVQSGAMSTSIGNATAASGNVISASNGDGIFVESYATTGTLIVRNTIGWDTTVSVALPNLDKGIEVTNDAGKVTIGGASSVLGNNIQVRSYEGGVLLSSRNLSGSTVRYNRISGPATSARADIGIAVDMPSAGVFDATIANNTVRYCRQGLYTSGAFARPVVARNNFSYCSDAVFTANASAPDLGNLADASTANDGGNIFRRATLTRAISNTSNKSLKAEGNDWDTTSISVIETLIVDELDNVLYGRVDYAPLMGGITPAARVRGLLQLSTVSASPISRGVQIAYSLSAAASVHATITNMAGRTVAILPEQRATVGLNSLAWNGRTLNQTQAPAGRYFVHVTAYGADGARASSMTAVDLAL